MAEKGVHWKCLARQGLWQIFLEALTFQTFPHFSTMSVCGLVLKVTFGAGPATAPAISDKTIPFKIQSTVYSAKK